MPRSHGFEIETEIACEAVARGLRVIEVPVDYHPRIEGTTSKLRAFRDGRRILRTIVAEGVRLRPLRFLIGLAVLLALPAVLGPWPVAVASLLAWALAASLVARRGVPAPNDVAAHESVSS
jgi:hypothetical protein